MARAALPKQDRELVQIVDAALADAARKSGDWLLCRSGCTQCCHGVFPISQLDVLRLRKGMKELDAADPARAKAIRERASESVQRLSRDFPGDAITGLLNEDVEAEDRFIDFANDEPCPVLDPVTGACELYGSRPMTCRVFGPPIRSGPEGGLGVCELCYHGATPEEIAACELKTDFDELESQLIEESENNTGVRGRTIVAYCVKE